MTLHIHTPEELEGATREERSVAAAAILATLEPGLQDRVLFNQLARLVRLSTLDVTCFREGTNGSEVFLGKRPGSNDWWADQEHIPGNVELPTVPGDSHDDYDAEADGILRKETRGTLERVGELVLFHARLASGPRGSEQVVSGWTEVRLADGATEPAGGRFVPLEDVLAEPPVLNLIGGHAEVIRLAAEDYRLFQQQQPVSPPTNLPSTTHPTSASQAG